MTRIVGVIGAAGFVGRHVVDALVRRGDCVVALSRREHENTPQVQWVSWSGEEAQPAALAVRDWICVAPIWALEGRLRWLESMGAERIVATSSTSRFTKAQSPDEAERSVARGLVLAEDELAAWAQGSGKSCVILRPTLIYGHGEDRNITDIAGLIRRFGCFPLIGGGRGLRQPIHVQDVVAAVLASLDLALEGGARAYNVSGGETLSYRAMVERIFRALGRPVRFVPVPMWCAVQGIRLARCAPKYKHWNIGMAHRVNDDLVFDHDAAVHDLGLVPRVFRLDSAEVEPKSARESRP